MEIAGRVVDQHYRDMGLVIEIAMDRSNARQLVGVEQILGIGASPRFSLDQASLRTVSPEITTSVSGSGH